MKHGCLPITRAWIVRAVFIFLAFPPITTALAAPCRIEVVEKGTGWPVPLVELETTNNTLFVTDNAGLVAFNLPAFMGRETWLTVRSDGYEVEKDGLGNRGFRLMPTPGAITNP